MIKTHTHISVLYTNTGRLEQVSQGSDHILISTAQMPLPNGEDEHSPTP